MNYCGTEREERIYFCSEDGETAYHVDMERSENDDVFFIKICCDPEWVWAFYMSAFNYEVVKHTIMDIGFSCKCIECMKEIMDTIFERDFTDIIAYDCEV